ncbi:hypothetical protein M885DRAFT_556229 [Pelagophyceae sp. CCMP2097]|nr:hypothetical protein M885DRAFT_556229 [Pelagophyceae sp. CCMP2097]
MSLLNQWPEGGWIFLEFENAESAMQQLGKRNDVPETVVLVDQSMKRIQVVTGKSEGGMEGVDLVRWLVARGFSGLIVSATGNMHLRNGADAVWGKPLRKAKVTDDLANAWESSVATWPRTPRSALPEALAEMIEEAFTEVPQTLEQYRRKRALKAAATPHNAPWRI